MVLAVIISFLVLLINLPLIIVAADKNENNLASDKKALIAFYNALPMVGRNLSWNFNGQVDDICNWEGITCKPITVTLGRGSGNEKSKENRVVTVVLPGKGLYGPIAANSIGELDALERLSLRSNFLYGSIPSDILSIRTLKSIYLQHNNFCGVIPRFPNFDSNLRTVDLSFNSFTGNISRVLLMKMKQRITFNLQFNFFSGHVPKDLDHKKIKVLNLGHNMLEGQIPSSLQKFPAESFEGNDGLCGQPLGDCPISPAYPPLSSAPYSNKLGAIALVRYCSSIIIILLLRFF